MSKLFAATAMGLVLAVAASCAQAPATDTAAAETSTATPARVDNFRLVEAGGKAVELYRMKDASAIVMVMHAAGSADVAKMAPELAKLQAAYAGKGVEFLLVNSNPNDTREAILADVQKNSITARIVQDDNQLVGEQLGATRVAETFVVDPKTWKIAYRGPLSADAVEAVVAGKEVAVASATAKGAQDRFPGALCEGESRVREDLLRQRRSRRSSKRSASPATSRAASPRSQMTSYEMVKGFAPMIREVIRTDRMPPCDADPHVGKFEDDKSLARGRDQDAGPLDRGRRAARHGGPDPLAEVEARRVRNGRSASRTWSSTSRPTTIPALGRGRLPVSGRRQPADRRQVAEGLDHQGRRAPGRAPHPLRLHEGSAEGRPRRRAAGASRSAATPSASESPWSTRRTSARGCRRAAAIAFQMHYTPFGKEVTDKSKIGLYFYKDGEKPDLMMREIVDRRPRPSRSRRTTRRHKETAYVEFPKDALLYSAVPHAHYRGYALQARGCSYPDGKKEMLLNMPHYDFNWQREYELRRADQDPGGLAS